MKPFVFILTCVLTALTSVAQVNVSGTVLEEGSNSPLTGASVILRNAEGKIKKYATSDAKGKFSISSPEIRGYTLDVSMMGFAKQTVKLDKRIELSAMLNNIFNQRTYNYTTYSQLSSFESRRWLRGRELLFTISLRK